MDIALIQHQVIEMISVLTLPVISLLLSVPLTWNNWGETQRMPKIIGCKNGILEWVQTSPARNPDDYVPDKRFEFDDFSAISDVDLYLRLADGKLIKEKGVARNGGISVEIKSNSIKVSRGTVSISVLYKGDILCLSDKFDGSTEGFFLKYLR